MMAVNTSFRVLKWYGVATCYNCNKGFSSHDGFGRHVAKCCSLPEVPRVPLEYLKYRYCE